MLSEKDKQYIEFRIYTAILRVFTGSDEKAKECMRQVMDQELTGGAGAL